MDPKKILILVILLVMLVLVGKWGYSKFHRMNTPPAAAGAPGYSYGPPAASPSASPAPAK